MAILDPTIFPRAKSGWPIIAAWILTINSGADVANDTTVIPTINFGIFSFKDIDIEPSNSNSPPFINKIILDLTFRESTADSPKAIFTVKTRNFPGGAYLQSDVKNVTRSAAATSSVVEQFTDQVNLRVRGRSFAVKIASTDTGVSWRLGSPRLDVKPDGRR